MADEPKISDRAATNCSSAQASRDKKRDELGDQEYKRLAAQAERERRQKKKRDAEVAELADEVLDTPSVEAELRALLAQTTKNLEEEQVKRHDADAKVAELANELQTTRARLAALEQSSTAHPAPAPPAPPPQPEMPAPEPAPASAPAPAPAPAADKPIDITALSDMLGVSSARNLGARDMLLLRSKIFDSKDTTNLMLVLQRLAMSTLTAQQSASTGIEVAVAGLLQHEHLEVRALSGRIGSAWAEQLAEELRHWQLASKTGPKPKGTGSARCLACQGKHRAHTCV